MPTLSLYSLLHNYLQHGWNVTSITSAVLMVRDSLLPATTLVTDKSTNRTTIQQKKKLTTVLYPTYIKEPSEVVDFFMKTPITSSNTGDTTISNRMENTLEKAHLDGLFSSVTPGYRAPRRPIVLCHGLYGFDRTGPDMLPSLQVHYWSGIEKALCDLGAKVIVTRVPKTETISNRAYTLHSILSTFMSNQEINLIAHSMGGLDCRYLLSHMKHRSYRVSSLSTICTPHRGSPLMDWFRDNVGLGLLQHNNNNNTLYQSKSNIPLTSTTSCMMGKGHTRRSGHDDSSINTSQQQQQQQQQLMHLLSQWFDTPAYSNLTTDYCTQHLNPSTPDDPSVSYYSYTAKTTPSYWSSLLGLPGQLIQQAEGDNDGVVSVNSGQWGKHVRTIDDADHWDFTGKSMVPYRWKSTTNSDFDRTEFYVELANYLYEQGH
ncbi:Alpha/Beta hydrolase protein [Chlamydoabsidia padenii]|nr:Alpha/Beta hydrolase protein [Chlamydoabsidia padenii]